MITDHAYFEYYDIDRAGHPDCSVCQKPGYKHDSATWLPSHDHPMLAAMRLAYARGISYSYPDR